MCAYARLGMSIGMQGRVEKEQLQERKGEGKKVIEKISCSSGTVFLISLGCNWLRTPLPTRHQCGSCQRETAGQPLVAPSPSFTIIYLCLDTHTNTHKHAFFPHCL